MARAKAELKKRINVTFTESVLKLLDELVPPRERNRFIVDATEKALRRAQLLKALQESSGAWADEDHPDLMTIEDVERYVRRLRDLWMPQNWDELVKGIEQKTPADG